MPKKKIIPKKEDELIIQINKRIEKEHSKAIEDILSDESLMNTYLEQNSSKKNLDYFTNLFKESKLDDDKINFLMERLKLDDKIVPPGAKGAIRGNRFNQIIKDELTNRDKYPEFIRERFRINFEKKIDGSDHGKEKPDFTIEDLLSGKKIIGMNQYDLDGGGHQLNRGRKYICENGNKENIKYLCVIAKKTIFKTNCDSFYIYEQGFRENTLCYLNNLRPIIAEFFDFYKFVY